MALKIALKPGEKMIIGGAVIRNGDKGATIHVENNVPILREKDIMREEDADTYCSRIYFVVQLMYIDRTKPVELHNTYWKLVRELVEKVPRTLPYIDRISQHILDENYYQALKIARKLIAFEKEALSRVRKPA